MLVARVFMLAASIKSYKKPLRGARLGKETGNSTTGPVRCVNGLKAHIIGRSCRKSNEQKLSSELLTLKDTKTIVYIIYLYMFVCKFILNHTCVNIDKCEAIHVFNYRSPEKYLRVFATKKKFPSFIFDHLGQKKGDAYKWPDIHISVPKQRVKKAHYDPIPGMCKVCTEAVHSVALQTRVTLHVCACVKHVPKQSIP